MEFFAVWIIFFLALFNASRYIYFFQIKEYRFDRVKAHIQDVGFQDVLLESFKFPAKSLRNILIAAIIIIMLGVLAVFNFSFSLKAILLVIVSFFVVPFAVILTNPLAKILRNRTIQQAIALRNKSNTIFIGVTGSYGKSSVKTFVTRILSSHFRAESTKENYNTDVGVALSLLKNLKEDTEYFVTEMGAYRQGEIESITNFIRPTYGILTGLGNQHIGIFGSKEKLILAKRELLDSLPKEGTAYVNADAKDYENAAHGLACKVVLYSITHPVDIYARDLNQTKDGTQATVMYKEKQFQIQTNLVGEHNLLNLLPGIALGLDLGIPIEKIADSIKTIGNSSRFEQKTGKQGETLLLDLYSTNVNGFIEAIKLLSQHGEKQYIITRGILELGAEKLKSYELLYARAAESNAYIMTTDKDFQKIEGDRKLGVVSFFNSESELYSAYENIEKNTNTTVLFEGRFSPQLVAKLKKTFRE